jgi:hypothetical protein
VTALEPLMVLLVPQVLYLAGGVRLASRVGTSGDALLLVVLRHCCCWDCVSKLVLVLSRLHVVVRVNSLVIRADKLLLCRRLLRLLLLPHGRWWLLLIMGRGLVPVPGEAVTIEQVTLAGVRPLLRWVWLLLLLLPRGWRWRPPLLLRSFRPARLVIARFPDDIQLRA